MNKILRAFLYVFFVLLISSSLTILIVSADNTGQTDSSNAEEIQIVFTIEIVTGSGSEYYLSSLAQRYGTTVNEIVELTEWLVSPGDTILPNQIVRVPVPQGGILIDNNNLSHKITATLVSGSIDESVLKIVYALPPELQEYIDIVPNSNTVVITGHFSNNNASIDDVSFDIFAIHGDDVVGHSTVRVSFKVPTIKFNPERAKITDDIREARVDVEGTAKGEIKVDFSAGLKHLQGYITVSFLPETDTIVINAVAPLPADWSDQMKRTSFDIIVKRGDVEAKLMVDVNFTATQNAIENEETTPSDSKPPGDGIEISDIRFGVIIVLLLVSIIVIVAIAIALWRVSKSRKEDGKDQGKGDITRGGSYIPQKTNFEKRFKSSAKVSDDQKSITLETTVNKGEDKAVWHFKSDYVEHKEEWSNYDFGTRSWGNYPPNEDGSFAVQKTIAVPNKLCENVNYAVTVYFYDCDGKEIRKESGGKTGKIEIKTDGSSSSGSSESGVQKVPDEKLTSALIAVKESANTCNEKIKNYAEFKADIQRTLICKCCLMEKTDTAHNWRKSRSERNSQSSGIVLLEYEDFCFVVPFGSRPWREANLETWYSMMGDTGGKYTIVTPALAVQEGDKIKLKNDNFRGEITRE